MYTKLLCCSLSSREVAACLTVTGAEVCRTLAQVVDCVGCRRSVETLHKLIAASHLNNLDPLVVAPDGTVRYCPISSMSRQGPSLQEIR